MAMFICLFVCLFVEGISQGSDHSEEPHSKGAVYNLIQRPLSLCSLAGGFPVPCLSQQKRQLRGKWKASSQLLLHTYLCLCAQDSLMLPYCGIKEGLRFSITSLVFIRSSLSASPFCSRHSMSLSRLTIFCQRHGSVSQVTFGLAKLPHQQGMHRFGRERVTNIFLKTVRPCQ